MFYKMASALRRLQDGFCPQKTKQHCVIVGESNTHGWICDLSVAVVFGEILFAQKAGEFSRYSFLSILVLFPNFQHLFLIWVPRTELPSKANMNLFVF